MSIQGSMNRGINIASFLYQQTPEYEARQNLKRIRSVTKRLDEQASELPEGLNTLSEKQLELAKDPRRDLTTEEGLSKYVNDATTLSNIYEDTLKQAEDLTKRFMQLRGELKGGKLTNKQEKELVDMHNKFADSLVTTRNMRYEFDKHTNEFNDAIGSTMSKIREKEEDERNGVENISPSPMKENKQEEKPEAKENESDVSSINKENKPVNENLSTTEEDNNPVQEIYETSPAKEDLSPAGKEVQRILAEDRAAESVMRAQQRQQRHTYMMDRARKMLNKQYDSGEINPYEWDTAMTENGLWGRNK